MPMKEQNRIQKQEGREGRHSVLGSKEEFLHPQHTASAQPSHRIQEMGQSQSKAQMKEGPSSRRPR
jgi:hypothetical protein